MFLNLYGDRLSESTNQFLYNLGYYKTDRRARKELMKIKMGGGDFLFHWAIRLKLI